MAEKIEIAKVQLGLDTSTFEQQFQNLISKFPNDIMKLFDALNKYSGTKNIGESLFREPIQKAIEQSKKDYQNFAEFVADINRQITDQSLKFTYNTKAGRATIGGTGYKSSDLATITKEVEKVITAQKTKTTPADKKSTSNNADALNRTLTQTVDNLNTTVQNLNSASSSLNTSATNIGNSASALGTANANLGNTSQSISGASATLNTAAQAVSNAANALSGAAQNTGNPSTNSSTGGGDGGKSSRRGLHIDALDASHDRGQDTVASGIYKASAAVTNNNAMIDAFQGRFGDLIRNITLTTDEATGEVKDILVNLRLSARQSMTARLGLSDVENIMKDPSSSALSNYMLAGGSTKRTYVDEVSQIERYKQLVQEEYDLKLKAVEADITDNKLLKNKINYLLEVNQIEKDQINQARANQNRAPLTNEYDPKSIKQNEKVGTDPESIARLNRNLQERNNKITTAIKNREDENWFINEQIKSEQKLTDLVAERSRLEATLAKQTEGSQKYVEIQNRLSQVGSQITEVGKDLSPDVVSRITTADPYAQQQNLVSKLTKLETERFEAWQKMHSAMQKGNTEEAQQYQNIAVSRMQEYNTLLNESTATGALTNETRDLLNTYREYHNTQESVIEAKDRDIQRQKQENEVYSKATKSLQEYVELRREQGKLTNKAGKGDKGIYTAAYQNVQDKMSAITGTSGLGNLIDFSSGQMSLKSFNTTLGITREQYEKLRTVVAEANATIKDDTIKAKQESDLATLNKMITAYINLKKAQSTLQEYKARAYNDATVNQQQAVVDRLQAQYNALLKDNDALAKTSTYTNMVAEANAKMADNVTRSNQSNSKQLTLLERLKASFQRTAAVAFSFNIFNRLFMEMRQGLSNVIEKTKEFDKTMTEVQMVTNQTDTSVRKTLASYSELAKELGTTTDAVAKGNLEWLRQGKSAEDSAKLIRASTMMSTLGAMESSEATQKLTAILNSYKFEAEDAITVVDKLVNADLIAATSTEELATAFQYSASFASAAGVSFDKMVGMLTTASETTRLSAETVGQAFKSMFSRLQNVKAGKSIDDEGEAINDTEKVLKRYNITLRDSATEFRNLEDVLDDVGRRWNEFDTVEQAQIATAIAGVHQRNTFIAVMQNYDKVLEYTNKTMEASGTSAQKYTHYMSSLEAKINELTVQWEQFIQGFNQSGTIKIGVSLLSGLLSVLDALTNKAPILQSLLGAFVLSKGIKGVLSTVLKIASVISKFKGVGNSIKALANSFKSLAITNKTLKNVYTDMNVKLTAYQRQQVLQIATNRKLNTEAKEQALTNMGLSATETELVLSNTNLLGTLSMLKQKYVSLDIAKIQQILTNDNLTDSEKRVQIAFLLKKQAAQKGIPVTNAAALSDARLIVQQNGLKMSAMGATAAMTALNIAIGVVTFAISAGISAIMSWQQEQQQLRDNAIDTTNAYNEQVRSMEELMEKYKELKAKLDKTQDLDAQKEITSEILDIRNQVIDSYGAEATKIDFINGQLNETLGLWQQINQEQAQETFVKNKVEYQKALDYAESSGYWNYFDFFGKKLHGKTTDILSRQWSGQQGDFINLLKGIGIEGVEAHSGFGVTPSYRISGENVFDTYNKLVEISLKIQKELEHNSDLTDDEKRQLSEFQADVITEINAYDKDEDFTKNKQLYESAQQSVIDAMGVFKTNTGELVSPSALYDLYTGAIEDLNTLSANFDFGNQEMVDNWHKIVDEDIPKYQDYLQQLYDQTTDETQKGYLKKIIANLEKATKDATQKVSAENYISGQISGKTDLIKKINDLTTEELVASQDKQIVDMFKKLQSELKKQGIVMSVEEIAQAISDLGYTYKETEKITAAGLIENFSTDESEIKTITENIEKLNNAVKTVASGGVLDLEDLSDLRDAGIDVSALVEGGIDNIAEISKLRDDYIQSVIDGLDEQIKINNEVMSQDKNITEEEKQQIESENKMIELRKKAIQSAAEGVKTTANEYITALKSANEIIAQVQAYGNGTISEDILSSMVEQYADMAGYVEKYRLGMIDNDELLKAFKQFYNNDIDNFYDYQQKKYMQTDEYYSSWLNENSSFVEEFKNKYGIDLKNYTNYIGAKSAIENKYSKIRANAERYHLADLFDEDNNLKPELRGAISNAPDWYIKMLKEYQEYLNDSPKIFEEFTNAFDQGSSTASGNLDEEFNSRLDIITSRMKEAYSLIHELGQEGSQITLDTLDSMKSAYPAMSQYIDQYLRKEMSRAELLSKFEEMYEQDKINYKNAQIEKINYSEVAYSEFIKKNDDWVDEFKKDYQIDLENFSTFAAAKEAILNGMSKYIDINTGEFTDAGKYFINNVNSADDAIFAGAMYKVQHMFKKFAEKTSEFSEDVADDIADGITDAIEDAVYSIEDALSDVSTVLSKQVEYYEDIANGIVAAAQLEIDALDKEIDLLDKKNEAQQRQIALQEKLEALNKAKTQRSVREYNAETGQFEWTTNKKDIKKAQQEYDQQLAENEKQALEDDKEWLEKYGESFTNVPETIQDKRYIQSALNWLAGYRGVDVSTLSSKDLLSLSEKEQAAFRSSYGRAVDVNLGFEDAQSQKELRKAQTNLVSSGYATNGKTGFAFNWEAITNALGSSITTLAGTLDKYTEILKPTSFAETKPTANAVTNITNTGEVKNSYTFTGDMEFKFDKDVDADNFISKFVSKLQMQNGITTVK